MSGFSAEWLALREIADRRARHRGHLETLGGFFTGHSEIRITDLGCGTGSNLRAMASSLPERQRWRLVDHDPALLNEARVALSAWADSVSAEVDGLALRKGAHHIAVMFVCTDLARECERALAEPANLVTAAALVDLASAAWLDALARALAKHRTPFYTVLAYDGRETWTPPHPSDAAIHAAFLAHQGRDKGFGPAAGPSAAQHLIAAFSRAGYRVTTGDSAWVLGPDDAPLIRQLANGIAQAAGETGSVPAPVIAEWLAARHDGAACAIGHTDLLALPNT